MEVSQSTWRYKVGFCVLVITSMAVSLAATEEVHGKLTFISEEIDGLYATEVTLPTGPRRQHYLGGTADQTITCESCDVNRIQGIHYSPYYIHLAQSYVYIFILESEGWSLFQQLQLDPDCTPKYLEQAYLNNEKHYVVCNSAPRFQQISFDSEELIFYLEGMHGKDYPFLDSNAIIVGGMDAYNPSQGDDYLIWIEDNRVYAYSITNGIEQSDLLPNVECDNLTRLHPLSPNQGNPRFIVDCTNAGIEKRFEINDVLSGVLSAISIIPEGIPIESPGGDYLLFLQTTNIEIHTSDYEHYSPKSFSSGNVSVKFFKVDGRVYLAVAIVGEDLVIIDVALFVDSGSTQGIHELINTAQTCPATGRCLPHGLVQPKSTWYLAIVQDQNHFTAHFHNLDNPSNPPQIVSNIPNRPELAFVELLPVLPTSTYPSFFTPPSTHIVPTVTMSVNGSAVKVRGEAGLNPIGIGIASGIIIALLVAIVAFCIILIIARKITGYIRGTGQLVKPIEANGSDDEVPSIIISRPVQASSEISKSRDKLHINNDSGFPSSEVSFHPTPVANHRIIQQQQQQEQMYKLQDRLAEMSTQRSDTAMSEESDLFSW